MLKMSGIVIICLSVSLIGFKYYERLMFRKRYLQQLVMLARNCTNDMRASQENIFEILSAYSCRELSFLEKIDRNTINNSAELERLLTESGIHADDRTVVADFLSRLGVSDITSQKTLCECFSARLLSLCGIAEKEANEKGKLIRSLCLLSAAAIFIILI